MCTFKLNFKDIFYVIDILRNVLNGCLSNVFLNFPGIPFFFNNRLVEKHFSITGDAGNVILVHDFNYSILVNTPIHPNWI